MLSKHQCIERHLGDIQLEHFEVDFHLLFCENLALSAQRHFKHTAGLRVNAVGLQHLHAKLRYVH